MRTRIALVAIIPVALITVSTLAPAAPAPSAQAPTPVATTADPAAPVALPPSTLAAYHGPRPISSVLTGTSLLRDLSSSLAAEAALHEAVLQNAAAAAAAQAAWERVAMCEEGGNWQADGGRFSGGLGISRANWIAYGGGEFASEGAMATEDQQIMVAERIQSTAPDQYGCHGW